MTDVYVLQPDEVQVLAEVCRTLDQLDALQAAVAEDGATVPGSKGQTRAHPALTELRQMRLALGRLLAQLELPDPEAADGSPALTSPASARARRAARARWGVA